MNNVKSLRKARNLTLSQLSKLSGVSANMLGYIENTKCNPTIYMAYKICRALNKDVYDVFPDVMRTQ